MTTPARSSALPNVPTVAAGGPVPGFDASPGSACWHRAARRRRWRRRSARTGEGARGAGRAGQDARTGAEPAPTTPEAFAEVLKQDRVKWGDCEDVGGVRRLTMVGWWIRVSGVRGSSGISDDVGRSWQRFVLAPETRCSDAWIRGCWSARQQPVSALVSWCLSSGGVGLRDNGLFDFGEPTYFLCLAKESRQRKATRWRPREWAPSAAPSELAACGRSDSGRLHRRPGPIREAPHTGGKAKPLVCERARFCITARFAEPLCSASSWPNTPTRSEARRGVCSCRVRCWGKERKRGPLSRIALRRSELGPGRSLPQHARGVEPHPARFFAYFWQDKKVGRLPAGESKQAVASQTDNARTHTTSVKLRRLAGSPQGSRNRPLPRTPTPPEDKHQTPSTKHQAPNTNSPRSPNTACQPPPPASTPDLSQQHPINRHEHQHPP